MQRIKQSHLESEIKEQPKVLSELFREEKGNIREIADFIRRRSPKFIVFVARGSSDNAVRYGHYLLGANNRLPVVPATPSLLTIYGKFPMLNDGMIIGISQSGQSPDIVAVMEEGRRQGVPTISITNDTSSPIAEASDCVINLRAGQEISVAATKTYLASLFSLAMLSLALAQDEERWDQLAGLPDRIADVLNSIDEVRRAAVRYRYAQECVVVSRGYNYATAFEIALKLKELTYILAEPYSSADFRHGPLALIEHGFPVISIAPNGAIRDEMMDFLSQVAEREAELIVISSIPEALDLAHTPLPIPDVPEWLSPMVAVVPGQMFAMGLTLAKGFDLDHPRGLRKVTLTR